MCIHVYMYDNSHGLVCGVVLHSRPFTVNKLKSRSYVKYLKSRAPTVRLGCGFIEKIWRFLRNILSSRSVENYLQNG